MKIHLRTVSFIFLAVMLALCAVLISSTIKVPLQFSLFEKHTSQFQTVAQASISLQDASDYLTDESRLFAISGEWKHLENYFVEVNESKRREKALEQMRGYGQKAKDLKKQYEKRYGALTKRGDGTNGWNWIKAPWPWETEDDC